MCPIFLNFGLTFPSFCNLKPFISPLAFFFTLPKPSSLLGHPQQPTLPLLRVRVVYSDEKQTFNASRFGFKFEGLVANIEDLVIFAREKIDRAASGDKAALLDLPANLINLDDVSLGVHPPFLLLFSVLHKTFNWGMHHLCHSVCLHLCFFIVIYSPLLICLLIPSEC